MKKYIVIVVVSMAVGGWLVYRFNPQTITTEVIKDHIVTVIKHVKSPDGTEVTDTTTTEDKTDKTKIVDTAKQNDWHISVGAGIRLNELKIPVYKVEVNRRILGPFTVGVYGATDSTVGAVLGFQF